MALIESGFYSHAIGRYVNVNIVLPLKEIDFLSDDFSGIPEKFPVMYLLHGLSGNHTNWIRYSCVERYAEKKGIALVMPQMDNGYYTDNPYGGHYYDFLTRELPEVMERLFPISGDPKKRYVAGLSMGGYGALLAGLGRPDFYAYCASLSGRTGVMERGEGCTAGNAGVYKRLNVAFGENMEFYDPDKHEPCHMLRKLAENKTSMPRLFITCGTEDTMYSDTTHIRDVAASLGLDMTYWECPGVHDWDFWDEAIKRVIAWLPDR